MASLALEKGYIRLRKMKDESNEYVVPCHNEAICAMRLSDNGEYLMTVCEGGQYIRVWGWFEDQNGEMEPPMSLYMFEVNTRGGQIVDLQFSKSMMKIAATILKTESKNPNNTMIDDIRSPTEQKKI